MKVGKFMVAAATVAAVALSGSAWAEKEDNFWKPYAVGGLADLSRSDTIACKPGDTVIDLDDKTPKAGDAFIATVAKVGESGDFGTVTVSVTNDGKLLLAGSNSSLIVSGLVQFHRCTKIG